MIRLDELFSLSQCAYPDNRSASLLSDPNHYVQPKIELDPDLINQERNESGTKNLSLFKNK